MKICLVLCHSYLLNINVILEYKNTTSQLDSYYCFIQIRILSLLSPPHLLASIQYKTTFISLLAISSE